MARAQHAGPSTHRNRNRVTNKTRLKIIKESIDADSIVLDEDEEKARVVSTAGVDAEDANEHHLQAVLSAAATRHQSSARATRGAEKEAPSTAYIPTPDSTGKVENYDELYPPGRWKDPVTYVKSSDTVEESVDFALANGFAYYMDERDEEWLDKNNEEARGEGTSAQGAVSSSGTRSSRSTKKGKEPEGNHSIAISEDEFELVMSMFEKVTHEQTEFLHHGLESGSPFPPFSDYQDTFASQLSPSLFAMFMIPSWVPQPPQLLRMAYSIYPHWKERRIERGGHPIMPFVNLDETDTKNESYICFRRRESKAVRKTRAQQATYSDKMIRLQSELTSAMELATSVLQRESLKRETAKHGSSVWESRFTLIDLKRKFPTLGAKEDEELFYDRERVPKKIKTDMSGRLPIKLPGRGQADYGSPAAQAPIMPPKERLALIRADVEQDLAKRKERDQSWDNVVDNPYQAPPVPYPSRLFKYISAARASSKGSSDSEDSSPPREPRAFRVRVGRGGRMMVDRRLSRPPAVEWDSDGEDGDAHQDAAERSRRLEEQWRFDADDEPAVGPEGPEEHGRKLFDDYTESRLQHTITLFSEQDYGMFAVDPTLTLTGPDGRPQSYLPYRLGMHHMVRREHMRPSPLGTPSIVPPRHINGSTTSVSSNGSPLATRSMPPPPAVPQGRTPSNGIMRPPVTPTVPAIPQQGSPHRSPSAPNGINHESGIVNGDQDIKLSVPIAITPGTPIQSEDAMQVDGQPQNIAITSPVRPKSQTPSMTPIPNGFTIPSVTNFSSHIANGAAYAHYPTMRNGIVAKSALVGLAGQDGANGTHLRQAASYMPHGTGVNYASQLHAARQMQYAALQQQQQQSHRQQITLTDSAVDMNLTPQLSPPLTGVPQRAPSANGNRQVNLSRGLSSPALAQAMAAGQGRASPGAAHIGRLTPHPPHSPPNLLSPGQQHGSPPRPQPPMPSPSLQARQIVGGSGVGY
ncbi:enhancer of polycomb-like domain-containing protein [Phanerochaete sordida]|uniref:Enhancer of polycomb-like protein n=1 Tax=Phanerochaete sordida TaxID=48140 RepID=A0A9P3GDA0_9APHY|nr:enhancer of polycomb-like domain-containing protein [Phanerochaete sordida]